jgi:hypothetical protein
MVGPIPAPDPFRLIRATSPVEAIRLARHVRPFGTAGSFRAVRPIRPDDLAPVAPIRLDRPTGLLRIVRGTAPGGSDDPAEVTTTNTTLIVRPFASLGNEDFAR